MPRAVRLTRPLERTIYAGHPWIYRDALAPFEAEPGELLDVFDKRGRLVAKGLSFKDVGEVLAISPHTVTTHVKKIYQKLAVHSRGEAVYEAGQLGLL